MTFQPDVNVIRCRLHLAAPVADVYRFIATNEGRARFWAETAVASGRVIHFVFPNGQRHQGRILESVPDSRFSIEYLGGSIVTLTLEQARSGGTDLTLTDQGVYEEERYEVIAGWVSVLLALKAAVDFGVDLRNHDRNRTWDDGYVEN
jgi:uncharacterized protein YndB with AHSA1/START domain